MSEALPEPFNFFLLVKFFIALYYSLQFPIALSYLQNNSSPQIFLFKIYSGPDIWDSFSYFYH